jgi:hypothetical protein
VDAQVARHEQQRLSNLPTFDLNIRLANEFLKGAEYVETQSFLQTRQAIDFIHSSGTPLPTLKLSDTISTALSVIYSVHAFVSASNAISRKSVHSFAKSNLLMHVFLGINHTTRQTIV